LRNKFLIWIIRVMCARSICRMRELDIRRALRKYLKATFNSEPDTLFVEELGLCQGAARVDLAVINCAVHGYEIKSEQDTLERLSAQQTIYNKALDTLTVVATQRHIERIKGSAPKWWGLTQAVSDGDTVTLIRLREATQNPNVDCFSLVQLLWSDEVFEILRRRGLEKGFSGKPRRILWARLVENIPSDEIGAIVRDQLRIRVRWRSVERRTPSDGLSRLFSKLSRSQDRPIGSRIGLCTDPPN